MGFVAIFVVTVVVNDVVEHDVVVAAVVNGVVVAVFIVSLKAAKYFVVVMLIQKWLTRSFSWLVDFKRLRRKNVHVKLIVYLNNCSNLNT